MRLSILIILSAAILMASCEPAARYKVLSFFFDGVPTPEEARSVELKKETVGGRKVIGVATARIVYKHGPYAAKLCSACHVSGSSNRLVIPLEKLCFKCHEFTMDKEWVHGPFAVGGCTACHSPHDSRYESLLLSEPGKLCFYCHEEKAIAENEAHKDTDMQCVSCHDPHMSDKKYMLK